MTLEDTLFEDIRAGREVDIERALLIASGCDTEEKIAEYKAKMETLDMMLKEYLDANQVEGIVGTAKALHDFLWEKKPSTLFSRMGRFFLGKNHRYKTRQVYLTKAIDAQISPKSVRVGNCLGLTSLYTALALRNGLNMNVNHTLTHVLSVLRIGDSTIEIENCESLGFLGETEDIYLNLKEAGPITLVADIFCWKGKEKYETGKFGEAMDYFKIATCIKPNATHYYNLGMAKKELGMISEAIACYTNSIRLAPYYDIAYGYRGNARKEIGDVIGAELDLEMYRQLSGDSQ